MKSRTTEAKTTAPLLAILGILWLALALLMVVPNAGAQDETLVMGSTTTVTRTPGAVTDDETENVETVTMTIPVDEEVSVDVDIPNADVVVDTWRGDEVLVIVQKSTDNRAPTSDNQPVNIKITRLGTDIRIAAVGSVGARLAELDVSFRILVPEHMDSGSHTTNTYSLSKLTSMVWRVLGKEALKWIAR